MYDIVSSCNDPGIIPMLVAVKKMLALMQIIGPILSLVMMSVHFVTLIKNPDDKKAFPKIRNSAIALVVLFMVPVIVNAFFALLDDSTSFSSCWNSAVTNNTGTSHYQTPYLTESPSQIIVSPGSYKN